MKHTAQDFAQAEFARHRDGTKAMRRESVGTDRPWVYLTSDSICRREDHEMADDGGWTIVQTVSEDVPTALIREPYDLEMFRKRHTLRHDWHEPDNQNIGARIIGTHLDNAMGSSVRFEGESHCEFNVVLTRMDETDRTHQEDLAVVNLATLLSWAAQYGEAQR